MTSLEEMIYIAYAGGCPICKEKFPCIHGTREFVMDEIKRIHIQLVLKKEGII